MRIIVILIIIQIIHLLKNKFFNLIKYYLKLRKINQKQYYFNLWIKSMNNL